MPIRKPTMEDFWIQMGWYKVVYEAGKRMISLTRGKWSDEQVREDAVKFLVEEVLQKQSQDVMWIDFRHNMLGGLLNWYYDNSPYKALHAASYEIEPWEMATTPMGFYEDRKNRITATRWLVNKLGIEPQDIALENFYENRLGGLLHHYNGSPYKALLDTRLVTEKDEAYMRDLWRTRRTTSASPAYSSP